MGISVSRGCAGEGVSSACRFLLFCVLPWWLPVGSSTYSGTSSLFAAYIAGVIVSWFDGLVAEAKTPIPVFHYGVFLFPEVAQAKASLRHAGSCYSVCFLGGCQFGIVAGATYSGTSSLFAAYIAGVIVSWFDGLVADPEVAQAKASLRHAGSCYSVCFLGGCQSVLGSPQTTGMPKRRLRLRNLGKQKYPIMIHLQANSSTANIIKSR
jgi:hypothetical protein